MECSLAVRASMAQIENPFYKANFWGSILAKNSLALDKFIFWRVLSFWRSDRDLPPHITTRKTTAPYYYW